MPEARRALEEGIALGEAIADEFIVAFNRTVLGILLGATGDFAAGVELLQIARATQARIEDFEGGGLTLSGLAQVRFAQGDGDRAIEHYREALESFGRVGDQPEIARVHGEMGWVALAMHRPGDARRFFLNALRANDLVGSSRGTGLALMGLAATEASEGNAETAVTIAAVAEVLKMVGRPGRQHVPK